MTSNEEEYIRSLAGQRNPFQVPAHYFEDLPARVMSQLPERHYRQRRLRPWLYAAAFALLAALSATLFFTGTDDVKSAQQASVVTEPSFVDEAFDYAMIDNQDIYACLTSE